MTTLKQIAEYMYSDDVRFIEDCDEHEYIHDFVYIEYVVTNNGVVYMEPEFTNELREELTTETICINVSDVVDHRTEIYEFIDQLNRS